MRVDILERVQNGDGGSSSWRLIEVKSSTRVKDVHLDDLSIQSHVVLGAGLRLDATCLMHIDTGYLYRGGEVDLQALFSIEDVSEAVTDRRRTGAGTIGGHESPFVGVAGPDDRA